MIENLVKHAKKLDFAAFDRELLRFIDEEMNVKDAINELLATMEDVVEALVRDGQEEALSAVLVIEMMTHLQNGIC